MFKAIILRVVNLSLTIFVIIYFVIIVLIFLTLVYFVI